MGLNTCFRKQTLPVMKEIQLQNNSKAIFIICGQSLLRYKETLSAGYVAAGLLQVILPLIKLTLRIKRTGKIPKTSYSSLGFTVFHGLLKLCRVYQG